MGLRVRRTGLAAAMGIVLSIAVLAGPARADDPLFLNWATQLPASASQYDPSSLDDCKSGRIQCVDKVIRDTPSSRVGATQSVSI